MDPNESAGQADDLRFRIYEKLCDEIDERWHDQGSAEFRSAFARLVAAAESGNIDAAEYVAEICALPGPHHDPEAAYRWYYIALSQQGYVMEFNDLNHIPPHYGGVDGDFRNEAMVSGLVDELGFDRVRQLDEEAVAWLAAHKVYKFR
jgi:hypothetical protein